MSAWRPGEPHELRGMKVLVRERHHGVIHHVEDKGALVRAYVLLDTGSSGWFDILDLALGES